MTIRPHKLRSGLMPLAVAVCAAAVATCGKTSPADSKEQPPMTITLTSTAFADGQPMPADYTADGKNISPPLSWDKLPEGARQLALIMDDPDSGDDPWVHWVIYKIPADTKGLEEAVPKTETLSTPAGALQGRNSWRSNNIGYRGPSPPSGVHHYHFKIYALDARLDLKAGLGKKDLLKAMDGHILATGRLIGTYEKK